MITGRVLLFFVAFAGVAEVATPEIHHVIYEGTQTIDTSRSNYAISESTSGPRTLGVWLTISVNGQTVEFYNAICQVATKSISELSESELVLIRNALVQVHGNVNSFEMGNQLPGVTRHEFRETEISLQRNPHDKFAVYHARGYTVRKLDDNNYSVSKRNLPHNWSDIFVTGETVTFVHNDGVVKAKPAACMNAEEQETLNDIEELVNRDGQSAQVMASFEQKLEQTEQSLMSFIIQMLQNFKAKMDERRAILDEKLNLLLATRQSQQVQQQRQMTTQQPQ